MKNTVHVQCFFTRNDHLIHWNRNHCSINLSICLYSLIKTNKMLISNLIYSTYRHHLHHTHTQCTLYTPASNFHFQFVFNSSSFLLKRNRKRRHVVWRNNFVDSLICQNESACWRSEIEREVKAKELNFTCCLGVYCMHI